MLALFPQTKKEQKVVHFQSIKNKLKMPLMALGTASIMSMSMNALADTIYSTNFAQGLGIFTDSGRVTTGSYGVRLRGGADSVIVSDVIDVSGADNIALQYSRSTSGLDTGEAATASYSLDGYNYVVIESTRSVSGATSINIPASNNLYLKFELDASSYFETYEIASITVTGDIDGGGNGGGNGGAGSNPGACNDNLNPGLSLRTVNVNGVNRQYYLNIPQSYDATETPLLLDFHPLMTDAEYERDNSGTRELSEQENFIVAFPDGIDGAWNIGPCCTESRQVDDIGFARAIVADIKANACVDDKRVYAMGYSNGGGMSYHLACNATDLVAAVAPAAFDLVEEMSCNPSRPISVYSFRGRYDFIVPYSGGASNPPTSYDLDTIHFLGAEGTFEAWSDYNSCAGSATSSGYPSSCEGYNNCAGGTEVVLCTERFGSHSGWDAEDAWNFLKTKTLP